MDLVTPQLGLLVWPALSFLLLLLVLRKFAWKPILDSVNEILPQMQDENSVPPLINLKATGLQ